MDLDHGLDDDDEPSLASSMASMLMTLSESMEPVKEAIDAYRDSAIERGYSEDSAEVMAVEYHDYILRSLSG